MLIDSDLVDQLTNEENIEIRKYSFENRIELQKIIKYSNLNYSTDFNKSDLLGESSKSLAYEYKI